MPANPTVPELVEMSRGGDPQAAASLFPLVYDELRRVARGYLRRERHAHSLQATALVHEAYMRLVPAGQPWKDRNHFVAIAARSMRQILIEHARARTAKKRGGGQAFVTLSDAPFEFPISVIDLLALDEALTSLSRHDQRMADLVEMRFFGGLSIEDAADALAVSAATAKRWWNFSRAWLQRELHA